MKLPKVYRIDYSKIADADRCLYSAIRLLDNDCLEDAIARVQEARDLLQEYLNGEPLIEDSDVCNGLVKVWDIEDCAITTL